jgi:phosphoribosylanthranilate isomerase
MSGPWIKICGLTTPEGVAAALEQHVDAVGFVFHATSPRNVTAERALELTRDVPRSVLRIAVTMHPTQALVDEIAAVFRPDALQSDVEDFETLRLPWGMASLPVLRSGGARPTEWPDRFLYEGARSGTGTTADWDEARRLANTGQLVLAGGLSPTNVARAVAAVRPFGVDVSSGVEATPGVKDPARIRDFVRAARAAANETSESSTAAPRAAE